MFKFEITYVNEKKSKEVLTEETNESKEILDDGTGAGVTGYEKTEEQLKKAKYKLVKIAGFILATGLVALVGSKVYDNNYDKKMEQKVIDDTVGQDENGEIVYDEEDQNSIFLVTDVLSGSEYEFYLVKEVNMSDYAEYDSKKNVVLTYGEKYLGDDCYNIFGDDSTKKENNIKMYIDVKNDKLVSVIEYKNSDLTAACIEDKNENIDSTGIRPIDEMKIAGFQISGTCNVTNMCMALRMEKPKNLVSSEIYGKLKELYDKNDMAFSKDYDFDFTYHSYKVY